MSWWQDIQRERNEWPRLATFIGSRVQLREKEGSLEAIPEGLLCFSYLRVSTDMQEDSGLGIEAQRQMNGEFIRAHKWNLLRTGEEIVSGATPLEERPVFGALVREAARKRAVILVARQDRLTRYSPDEALAYLKRKRVGVLFADNPRMDEARIFMDGVMAQWQRQYIAKRTTEALAVKKANGTLYGLTAKNIEHIKSHGERARSIQKQDAEIWAEGLKLTIMGFQAMGVRTYAELAQRLNESHRATRNECEWTEKSVKKLLMRLRLRQDGTLLPPRRA